MSGAAAGMLDQIRPRTSMVPRICSKSTGLLGPPVDLRNLANHSLSADIVADLRRG
jgi:hypothetical protein